MDVGGDAAEQVVRLSLEGFEVAAKLTGAAAKEVALLLLTALKSDNKGKTKGKERLTKMIKSGKELKVFSIPQRDLKTFTQHAKKYGVLYCVLRDKYSKDPNAPIDIIARAEDASKIQRIVDRFEIGKVDKAAIVADAQKSLDDRKQKQKDKPEKSKGEIIVDEAIGSKNKEGKSADNPFAMKTEKSPPSEQDWHRLDLFTNEGKDNPENRPSVREKLERYKADRDKNKDVKREELNKDDKKKDKTSETKHKHKHPKKKKKSKSKSKER